MNNENQTIALPTRAHPTAGRDLHSALELCAAGTDQRLFGWYRRGRRVAYDVAKVGGGGRAGVKCKGAVPLLMTPACVHMERAPCDAPHAWRGWDPRI